MKLCLPVLCIAACVAAACGNGSTRPFLSNTTPETHARFFAIATGPHKQDCNLCHGTSDSFRKFDCLGCHAHEQTPTTRVHVAVSGYQYTSTACYSCHQSADGGPQPFSHTGIASDCASCHQETASFAALPKPGFTHPPMGGADCAACHVISSWTNVAGPAGAVADPARSLQVTALVPAYSAKSIYSLTPRTEILPLPMNHAAARAIGASSCVACHQGAGNANYYPGSFHSSLANLKLAQPGACLDCHAASVPTGFVGPVAKNPPRAPPSGEMKHDAVAWTSAGPTSTSLAALDCALCHASPSATSTGGFTKAPDGVSPATFHPARAAVQPPLASCIDCHANSRPAGTLSVPGADPQTSTVQFDHSASGALGDCVSCHASDTPAHLASWTGGRFHHAGDATPSTCLPCHASDHPTTTARWKNQSYTTRPFDVVTNANGIPHGDNQDCLLCHAGPGTGAWGGTQDFATGSFVHGAATLSGSTCVACHASQRPDLQPNTTPAAVAQKLGFDHAKDGTGDCFGCHQATVQANRYVDYLNPATRDLPGGDWQGGARYPGATLIGAQSGAFTETEIQLLRTLGTGFITGTSARTATLYNQMSHTSAQVPAPISPGPANNPNNNQCWHCHVNSNGTVTSFANGVFHAALDSFSSTPGGTVQPLPQPTTGCIDCHPLARPTNIVQGASSDLQPMDHAAAFIAAANFSGTSVASVSSMDCSVCHKATKGIFSDGTFHASLQSGNPQPTPKDCAGCHYVLMADAAKSDLQNGNLYRMQHRLLGVQDCATCHSAALSRATGAIASSSWQGGSMHAAVTAQPASCLGCHSVSLPGGSTQSTTPYSFAAGGTQSNAQQWMNHSVAAVTGKDCSTCHAGDARASGSAWSKSISFHAAAPSPGSCQACHGLGNGNGATAGTGNNLPSGLTDSTTLTTAAQDATTGVPAGTHDQINHADINVTSRDCNACHVQAGVSTAPGVAGREWAQAAFHSAFTAANPLIANGTTGRCSDCHMNVKPASSFATFDHSAFTATPGTQDCASCHSYPGTGGPSNANWLGAAASPQYISVGGFPIPQPPASTATTQQGIANLPHPAVPAGTSCTACHTTASGGKNANGYDHGSPLASSNCSSCHEAGSNLVGTAWNGATAEFSGAGDTRPYTLAAVIANFKGNARLVPYPNHFYPVDCTQCHVLPAGIAHVTTPPTYLSVDQNQNRSSGMWAFPHPTNQMSNPSTCVMCHTNGIPNTRGGGAGSGRY